MKITYKFETKDINAVRDIVQQQSRRNLVVLRTRNNIDGPLPQIDREKMWQIQFMSLLTTQQKSGPGMAVNRFLEQKPFPLSLANCKQKDVSQFVEQNLKQHGGIRFTTKIPKQAAKNLSLLEKGAWLELERLKDGLLQQRSQPPSPSQYNLERSAAQYLDKNLTGFGPKQSRNFWQELGLTRYEFVLDSRILRWLRKMDLGIPLSSSGLQDEEYYCWVSDLLRDLCLQANVHPCVFDAAVFASYDTKEWSLDE